MDQANRTFSRRSGQTMIMLTFAMVPMCGVMGMVTDLGYMHFLKTSAQTAAEVAAKSAIIHFHAIVGGAVTACGGQIVCQQDPVTCPTNIVTPTDASQVGCMYAATHGFQATGNQNVTYQTGGSALTGVYTSPPSISGVSNVAYWITYRVSQQVPQMFSALLGNAFQNGLVSARSTGAVVGANDCIYALNNTTTTGLQVDGNAELSASCGAYVNAQGASALACNGHGGVSSYAFNLPEYDVVGSSACSLNNLNNVAPNTGVAPASDPLAGLAAPASGPYTCTYTNFQVNAASVTDIVPLTAGTYCGGINVKKGIATFGAGTYILVGGGLQTQNSNSTIDASAGVLFYNTWGTVGSTTYDYQGFNIVANSNATMKAQTTGTYAGILVFEDRNKDASGSYADVFSGGSNATYEGVIYAKYANLKFFGNPTATSAKYTLVIADTIELTGSSIFNDDFSSLPSGSPINQAVLLE